MTHMVIIGGTGQLGALLARSCQDIGWQVTALGRHPVQAAWPTGVWDPADPQSLVPFIEGCDVVVNLAGRSVNCRYGAQQRTDIMQSRVQSVRTLGQALQLVHQRPQVWLQAGTATMYAHRYDAANDDVTGIMGGQEVGVPETWRFSVEVAQAWERAVAEVAVPDVRTVILRSSMVMTPDPQGVFDVLCGLVRCGLGGHHGDGRQYVSWIHGDDFVAAVRHLIAVDHLHGPVVVAAPNPLPNSEFMAALRDAMGVRWGLPSPQWLLEIGAWLRRTESELLLKSRRVVPTQLLQDGFVFQHPQWPAAAHDLLARRG